MINQEMLDDLVEKLRAKIMADIMGDGAASYSNYPFLASPLEESINPLTLDKMKGLLAEVPPSAAWEVRLIEVEPTPIYGPARRHKKRRIQKKWLKRYGTEIVGYDYPMGNRVLVDRKRGVGYCHPHAARNIRAWTKEGRQYV